MREFLFSILKGIYNWITKTWSNIQIPGEQMILSNLLQELMTQYSIYFKQIVSLQIYNLWGEKMVSAVVYH